MTKPDPKEAKKPEEIPEEEPETDEEDEEEDEEDEIAVKDFNEEHPPASRRRKPIRQEQAEQAWEGRVSLRFW